MSAFDEVSVATIPPLSKPGTGKGNSTCGGKKLCFQAEKMMPNGIAKH
jgi:hypothetical protein